MHSGRGPQLAAHEADQLSGRARTRGPRHLAAVAKQKEGRNALDAMALRRRRMQEVPKADVIITNPTHIAVALKYNALEAPAPMVVAKGADFMAEKIKEIAREAGVPIRENKPLARALYKSVEVGDIIPEELYQAVAAILASLSKFRSKAASQQQVARDS